MTTNYAPIIDSTGITIPTYDATFQALVVDFKKIYGNDIYIDADSQDGQWLGVLAKAITDCNQATQACFLAYSPTYAQGNGLSAMVKINGLTRNVPTNSTSVGTVIGVAGSIITNGVVQDDSGNLWNLPPSIIIPISGSIDVTVTAQQTGAIFASIGAINKIANPQLGWQSFTNTVTSTTGSPVETDLELRVRQGFSTALPALNIRESLVAALGNIVGITRFKVYENDTGTTQAVTGIPSHSICVVTEGGTATDIVAEIANKKGIGTGTFGTVSLNYLYNNSDIMAIHYTPLDYTPVYFAIDIHPLDGFLGTTVYAIQKAIVDAINKLSIGEDIYMTKFISIASLLGTVEGSTFYINTFFLGISASPTTSNNIVIDYNKSASCVIANISVTLTP